MSWLPKKTIVVPVDFSSQSVAAIHTALELVESPSAVHLIHVVLPLTAIAVGEAWVAEDVESRLSAARDYLAKYLQQNAIMGVSSVVWEGDPGLQIASHRPGRGTDIRAELHVAVAREGAHRRVVIEHEDQIRQLRTDLQAPAGAAEPDERRTRPAMSGPGHDHTFAALAAHSEADLQHPHDGETARIAQDPRRNLSLGNLAEIMKDID